jgi:Type IV pili methyl-accepting chemotaxis transducer N-term
MHFHPFFIEVEMLISRRQGVQALTALALLPALPLRAQAQISTAVAINRAARLRALSQRSTKLFAQMTLDVLTQNAKETLTTAQRLIQVSLDDLSKAALSGALASQFATVTQNANGLTASLSAPPGKDNLARINTSADRLLSEADKLTGMLEVNAKQGSAKLINTAGRQRMLSQRLAKNYFLAVAGLETPTTKAQLSDDRNEFKLGLDTLGAAPVSTPAIRNDLQLAQAQWMLFESALNRKADAESMKTVATTSERLLEISNNLTGQYETALRDLLGNT